MPPGSPPLVGRDRELRVLDEAARAVGEGASRVIVLQGEPGIGKSRLLAEGAARAEEHGLIVASGRAAELERDLTFALLVDALEPLLSGRAAGAVAAQAPDRREELAAVFPSIATPAGGARPSPARERHRVARTLRALLARVAGERPVAVVLDDVQWADPASADVLALLLHRPPEAGVLIALATRRPWSPVLNAALAAAERQGVATVLELGPLARQHVGRFAPRAGRAVRERLFRESGGNPFFLQELARVGVSADDGELQLAGVPRAVRAALAAELAALAPDARRVLEGAAAAGDPFEPELAATAADVEAGLALDALDALLDAELVRATRSPRRFRFRHPLVRRAVYEGAGAGWRLGAHARLAAALGARGATPAMRAHHVERAASPGDRAAVELLTAAAEEVVDAAPATAAGWYETALRLLPDAPRDRPRRLRLLRARARALVAAGRAADACDVLREVVSALPPEAARERVDATVLLAGLLAVWTQRPDEARRLLESERAALGDVAPGLRAAVTLALAGERAERGDHLASERLADRARGDARKTGDRALEAAAAARAADAAHCRLRGDDPAALAAVDARIAATGELVDALPDAEVARRPSMLVSLVIARTFTGDFEGARAAVERGLVVARGTGQGLFTPAFVALRGFVENELGRLDAAEEDLDEAIESAILTGNEQVAYWSAVGSGWVARARGRIDAAIAHGERAWELLGTRSYSQAGFSLADARLAAGDPGGAAAALEAFGWVRPQMWTLDRVKAAEIAVRVLLSLGRLDEASAWAGRTVLEGGGRRRGVFGAIAASAQASVLLAQGAAVDAARVALGGAEEAHGVSAPLWAGRCRTLAGEALLASGRVQDARRELRRSAAELEAHGAWGFRDAALRALRRLGDRPRAASPAPRGPDGDGSLSTLSPRERDVARLVAEGLTNGQIAARLHISERTVEKHVSSLLAKLRLDSRTGVVALLAREHPPLVP